MEEMSDEFLMRLHLFYQQHKNNPVAKAHLCGLNIHKRIEQLEYEIFMRTKVKHMWNIEILQRDNNITPTV